jgi:hypothetical protein
MPHKFRVGEIVSLRPGRNVPGVIFEVVKQLPGNDTLCSGQDRAAANSWSAPVVMLGFRTARCEGTRLKCETG